MSKGGREWGRLEMMRKNPPKRCRDETGNGRESDCRNRERRRNKIDAVDADSEPVRRQPGRGGVMVIVSEGQ